MTEKNCPKSSEHKNDRLLSEIILEGLETEEDQSLSDCLDEIGHRSLKNKEMLDSLLSEVEHSEDHSLEKFLKFRKRRKKNKKIVFMSFTAAAALAMFFFIFMKENEVQPSSESLDWYISLNELPIKADQVFSLTDNDINVNKVNLGISLNELQAVDIDRYQVSLKESSVSYKVDLKKFLIAKLPVLPNKKINFQDLAYLIPDKRFILVNDENSGKLILLK